VTRLEAEPAVPDAIIGATYRQILIRKSILTTGQNKSTERPGVMGPLSAAVKVSYANGIGNQIQCREDYDTLLEMEQMGGKIRDSEDEYAGAEGRYNDTKLMLSPRYSPNHSTEVVIRIWGTTFKPALKKECKRLGVKIFDRVMVTSLLTEGGVQGTKVVGATGFNNRTGEFMVFKSKAAITGNSRKLFFMAIEHRTCRL